MSLELALKLQRIGSPRILVVGDEMQDADIHCEPKGFSQEAAHCPVWKIDKSDGTSGYHFRVGGAGAVAAMAEALGSIVRLISAPSPYMSMKTRYLIHGQQVLRIDNDARPLSTEQTDRITAQVADEVQRADCVLIADYGKGVCTDAVLRVAIDGAHACRIPCIADPHQKEWQSYKGALALKMNHLQACAQKDQSGACKEFSAIIVTHGQEGIDLGLRLEGDSTYPASPRTVIDVTGAGDMVLACIGICIVGGMTWQEACQVANSAAGLKVERRGAVPIPKAEVVLDLLDGEKIIPAELLPAVRASHNKVVWTNGAFDLLGPHHLYLLQEARKHGDVLIVGLNNDASVRRLKGPKRPIMRQEQRAAMLAGLACVDYVMLFSEDTPLPLLAELRPDVLVKADDPERNTAGDGFAGKVVLLPMIAGASTTRTLDAIRQP